MTIQPVTNILDEIAPIPIRRILAPLDGSLLAEAALVPAISLARQFDALVILVHVLEQHPPSTVHGQPHVMTSAEGERYLAPVAQRFREAGVSADAHVHSDPQRDVAASLVAHAKELGIDLIVLASHGSGGIRQFLFGRVAGHVLQRGSCPVLLVQAHEPAGTGRDFGCQTVALLLDGTSESRAALPAALTLATAYEANLHLIRVAPTLGTLTGERSASAILLPGASRAILDLEAENAVTDLRELAGALNLQGVPVTFAVVRGEPAQAAVNEAERVAADVLVMATHGREGLAGIWSGSIGSKVLKRYNRYLLLVPAP